MSGNINRKRKSGIVAYSSAFLSRTNRRKNNARIIMENHLRIFSEAKPKQPQGNIWHAALYHRQQPDAGSVCPVHIGSVTQRSSSAPITVLSRVPKLSGVVGDAGRARYSAADMSVSYEAAQAVN